MTGCRHMVSLGLVALALAGCPEEDPVGGDGTESGDASTSGSAGTESADTTAGMEAESYARGLSIRQVDANSGAAITLFDGNVVAPGDRNGPLPKNRNTAFRVYVDVDEDTWVQREIEGRLTITLPDGTESTLSETVVIASDSSTSNVQSNFLFGAFAELMVPGAEYRIELFETGEEGLGLPEPSQPTAVPVEGSAPLGIEESTQRMRVMLVPVDYTAPEGNCSGMPDTSEEGLAAYVDALYQHNPVEDIELMVHEPLVVDDLDLSFTGPVYLLLARLSNLRADEDPDPDVYYYALFDNCGACISSDGSGGFDGCLLGVASGIPEPTQGAAAIRVAVGVDDSNGSGGPETFVHEIGHGQGRDHVACPGQTAAGPDPSYPYDDGSIGVWGFGILDFAIRNPNHTDYMSYCRPTWVSDWQWDATFDRIEELSSWGYGTDEAPPKQDEWMLVGAVDPDSGAQRWWTARGSLAPADFGRGAWPLTYAQPDGGGLEVVAAVDAWSEGSWVSVRAPLPAGMLERAEAIELTVGERRLRTPTTAIATR